jgi:hypothetical protein
MAPRNHSLDVPQNTVSGFLAAGTGGGDTGEEDAGAGEMDDDAGNADTNTVSTTSTVVFLDDAACP